MRAEASDLYASMIDGGGGSGSVGLPPPVIMTPEVLPFTDLGWARFEALAARMAMVVDGHPSARVFGTSGQKQGGIDVIVRTTAGSYRAFQCKCVRQFKPTQLRSAVEEFAANRPLGMSDLTVVIACADEPAGVEAELAELRHRFPDLTLDAWYGRVLSGKLRDRPELVREFFGPYWVHAFCTAEPAPARAVGGRGRPRQLPAALGDFTGRHAEMSQLIALAERAAAGDGAETAAVIVGVGGSGKTSLAVQAAHISAGQFPDGALYVNLDGSSDAPVDPSDALATLLRALGTSDEHMPAGQAERSALYRSEMAERRVIVVLDDAVDEAQIRPLRPGTTASLMLVTSRNRLLGLSDVRRLDLDVLTRDEAVNLLATIAPHKVAVDPDSAAALAQLCGGLPLAIRIVGNQLSGRHGWGVRHLASRLTDERERLSELHAGDLDVRACFELSFRRLPAATRALFRRLCLIPGPYFDTEAARLLTNTTISAAATTATRRQLRELTDLSLVVEDNRDGCYRLHDLIRVFAQGVLDEQERPSDIEEVRLRVVRYLVDNGRDAGRALGPELDSDGSVRSTRTEAARPAADWLDRHWPNLSAALHILIDRHYFGDIMAVVGDIGRYVEMRCHHSAWLALMRHAGKCAADAGNPTASLFALLIATTLKDLRMFELALQHVETAIATLPGHGPFDQTPLIADAENLRGVILTELYRTDEALQAFEHSRTRWLAAGNEAAAAMVLHNIAGLYRAKGMYRQAIDYYEQDLAMAHKLGDSWDQARTLNSLGNVLCDVGRTDEAIAALRHARELYRKVGDHRREGHVLNDLGFTLSAIGRTAEARECLTLDMQICLANNDQRGWAMTAINVSQVARMEGDWPEALRLAQQALPIIQAEGSQQDLAAVLTQLALCYGMDDRTSDCLATFESALAAAETAGDIAIQVSCAASYALTLREFAMYPEAEAMEAKVAALRDLVDQIPTAETDR